jgi:flagellar basal body rod protein FlgC
MIAALSIAASGLQDAKVRLEVAANHIAHVNTEPFRPSRLASTESPADGVAPVVEPVELEPISEQPPGTDLVAELLSLVIARLAFAANLRVLDTAAETHGDTMSLLA